MPPQPASAPAFSRRIFARRWFWATVLFFGGLLAIGLSTFTHYGISTDERIDYYTGLVNARYILKTLAPSLLPKFPGLSGLPELATYHDRHYGIIFQLPAAVLPGLLGFTELRHVYFVRHLLTFLFFFGGLLFFWQVLRQRFGVGWWPLLGCLLLVLSPRIYADAFYNGKDIVFLAVMVAGWFTLNNFRRQLTWKGVLLHALASAIAIDTRIMGLLLPGLTFLWVAHLGFYTRSWHFRKKLLLRFLVYGILLAGFTVLFWPFLWENPVQNFLQVFQKLERESFFRVLYFGRFIPFNQLPWHYVPGWLLVTTPLSYTFWFLVGTGVFLGQLLRKRINLLHTEQGQQDTSALLLFLLPLAAVTGTNAILYDGWRHLYFIYPPFVYLAVLGLQAATRWLRQKGRDSGLKTAVTALLFLTMAEGFRTAWLMAKMHPYQNVYFSFLSPAYVERSFERDYWGLSYREGLEYILATDPRPVIKVYPVFVSGSIAWDILKPGEKRRLQYVDEAEADYVLAEYRWHPQPYPYQHEVYQVRPNGLKILSVFKLK